MSEPFSFSTHERLQISIEGTAPNDLGKTAVAHTMAGRRAVLEDGLQEQRSIWESFGQYDEQLFMEIANHSRTLEVVGAMQEVGWNPDIIFFPTTMKKDYLRPMLRDAPGQEATGLVYGERFGTHIWDTRYDNSRPYFYRDWIGMRGWKQSNWAAAIVESSDEPVIRGISADLSVFDDTLTEDQRMDIRKRWVSVAANDSSFEDDLACDAFSYLAAQLGRLAGGRMLLDSSGTHTIFARHMLDQGKCPTAHAENNVMIIKHMINADARIGVTDYFGHRPVVWLCEG